ncbi:hypothetical protein FKV75_03800 [Weissella paramesenteroides]|uniref:hypothetical protein n=1 Tax=Weissella paramesenteroides TaxID=1249 RepID=UPI00123AF7F9|nr:hypothetical protein [Weissella paramesenteroides]KAA8440448.1 hypothetical protein FKV77_08205 [Weissella paramesenteroides]KAA8440961.1 hypothetical protein FKV81_04775 [Weissella paramesenteroides]KAA8443392.1 hypothetical protein FKV75_03800 [Weissella paramesenteroides]KAA8447681.1 hypothetical protein FKV76_04020 [Weissella paramesenteroides]KAA8449716.1 hypothetical protein FKV74_05895 [Weissella paramesenteroides]
MGIKKINDYVLSEHAQDRLLERFKTTKSNWNAWLTNFNKDAELKHIGTNDDQGREVWLSGEVGMVIETVDKIIITVFHVYGKSFPESLKIDLRNTALRLQDKAEMAFKERTKELVNQLAYRDVEAKETEQVISQMVQAKAEYNTYCDGLFALANSQEMEK